MRFICIVFLGTSACTTNTLKIAEAKATMIADNEYATIFTEWITYVNSTEGTGRSILMDGEWRGVLASTAHRHIPFLRNELVLHDEVVLILESNPFLTKAAQTYRTEVSSNVISKENSRKWLSLLDKIMNRIAAETGSGDKKENTPLK